MNRRNTMMATGIKQRYDVKDLSVGMYVASLDKPACNTPLPLGGFYIRTKEELLEVAKHCSYVMVNITKGRLAKELSSTMQLEVIDIPAVIRDPKGYRARQESRPAKKVNPRQKGRLSRLFFLLSVCVLIWQFR